MRIYRRLTILLTLALAGCAGDSALSPIASLRSVDAAVTRPWGGQCDVAAAFTGPTTLLITGTCELAHLGRTTVVTEETLSMETGAITNTSTYTAANGDKLFTAGSGVATFRPDYTASIAGTWTVVGGTGRFAGATGTAAYAEEAHATGPTTVVGTYTLDGWLAY
jgi:hypothetical protein